MPVKFMNSAGRPSLQLGRGVDSASGSPLGVAIVPDTPIIDPNNSGQIVSYDVNIIETSQELEESLGLSVGAEMRYGLFQATGKFEMREKTQYKEFATYIIAKCDVRNPPIGLFDPSAKQAAKDMRAQDSSFVAMYGDSYVRAALTGGEFYVIVEIVHSEVQVQKSLAASLQAEYNAFFSSAEISFSLSTDTKSKASQSQLRVIQYQASGVGVEVSIVTDVAGVMDRLKDFPRIAQAHPISVQVELAPYASIPGLQSNELAKFELREYLDDCARKRTTYKQVIDELDFLLAGQNRAYFESPPDDEEARQWRTAYTEAWGKVMAHATRLTEGGDITPYLEVAGLPTVRLKRRVQPAAGDQVAVPSLVGTQVDTARDMLSAVGLLPMPMPRTVSASDKTTARLTVLSQSPAAQALAAKGAQVQLDYAVNASRFARPFNDVMRSGALNVVKVLR